MRTRDRETALRAEARPPRRLPTESAERDVDPGNGDSLEALDDTLLVPRAAEGDEDAFAVLVYRHSGQLLGLAYQLLGNRADAEEALQDALISAWRQLPRFRGEAGFRTWMFRVVTNRCLNVLRSRSSEARLEAVAEPVAHDASGDPERVVESGAATAALAEALRHLPPGQRVCWLLREVHGLSYAEIAQVVGESEQTVRGRLFRARRTLTKEMAPWR